MTSRSPILFFSFVLVSSLPAMACSADATDHAAGTSDTSEHAQTSCEPGITLPDVRVDGYVIDDPVPAQKSLGLVLGMLDERSPTSFDPVAMATYTPAAGLRRKGWSFQASRGERFAVDSFAVESLGFEVYGPIAACKGDVTDAPAQFEGINGWRARATGTYFVTPRATLVRDAGGTVGIGSAPSPTTVHSVIAMRRLLAHDTPAGHAFVQRTAWSMGDVNDMAIRTLTGETAPAILAVGTQLVPGQYAPTRVPSLLVARRGDEPLWVPACGTLASLVVGDFTADGLGDVLSGTSLFVARADGGFTCETTNVVMYDYRPLGPVDLDGDGTNDLLGVRLQPSGDPQHPGTIVFVQPWFRRGTTFAAGAYRSVIVPLGSNTGAPARMGLVDVTGDGKPEIVAALSDPAAPAAGMTALAGFALPALAPQDSAPNASSIVLPLAPAAISVSARPDPSSLDNQGSRVFDADGDGRRDSVVLGRTMFTYRGFSVAYGSPAGGLLLPWDFATAQDLGGHHPLVEHVDFDDDGCEDLLLGGSGLVLFGGVRCAAH